MLVKKSLDDGLMKLWNISKPVNLKTNDNTVANKNDLIIIDNDLINSMKDLNADLISKNDNSSRPIALVEIELLNNYLTYIEFMAMHKEELVYIGDSNNKEVYMEMSTLLDQTLMIISSRLNKLIENELKWQSKNTIFQILDLIAWRLAEFRKPFNEGFAISGSTIDPSVSFVDFVDAAYYLPRAIQISFLSPFPYHWFQEGDKTGRIGRIISGFEMIIFYIILLGFCYATTKHLRRIKPLIPIVLLSGCIMVLVGYSLPNIGLIYRFRLDLIAPFFIIGSYGIHMLILKFNKN